MTLGATKRPRAERSVIYAWEGRAPATRWFSRKHVRAASLGALTVAGLYLLSSAHDYRRRAHITQAAIGSVMLATETFRADHGRCPVNIQELAHPPEVPGNSAHYLGDVRVDGWGRTLRLVCPGRKHPWSADVVSGGPSGSYLDLDQIE